ncbi:MAG: hypothetical protein JWP10_1222 [Nocardioidaceae bacterium]|nr:hypothetical protein [Nocardioidaceae bacterium]
MREELLDAASDLAIELGWNHVTMSKVAAAGGVSRQTVYNEFGTKPRLAAELIMRELERFLAVVSDRLLAHTDLAHGMRDAAKAALDHAADNTFVRAVLSSVPGEQNELLPLLTTESQDIIDGARALVIEIVSSHYDDLPFNDAELATLVDAVVRLVLSGITRPSSPSAVFADEIGWLVQMAIRGAAVPPD